MADETKVKRKPWSSAELDDIRERLMPIAEFGKDQTDVATARRMIDAMDSATIVIPLPD